MELNIFGIKVYIRKLTLILLTTFFIIIAGIIAEKYLFNSDSITISDKPIMAVSTLSTPSGNPAATPQIIDDIKVYVAGCVRNPGIVTVKKGQIIEDAIYLAGGTTEDADTDKINRVYKLKENVMIYVKSKNEQQKLEDQNIEASWKQPNDAGPGIEVISDSGGSILTGDQTGTKPRMVNINTATDAELDTLPGIGKGTAKTIIEYREKNGDFKDIKEIMKISGIKESKFNSIKDLITVDLFTIKR